MDGEFVVGDGEVAAGECDNGGDGVVGETLGEDFLADEAGGAGEDDFHVVYFVVLYSVGWR